MACNVFLMPLFILIFISFLLLPSTFGQLIFIHWISPFTNQRQHAIKSEATHSEHTKSEQINHLKFNQIRLKPIKGPSVERLTFGQFPTVIKANLPAVAATPPPSDLQLPQYYNLTKELLCRRRFGFWTSDHVVI